MKTTLYTCSLFVLLLHLAAPTAADTFEDSFARADGEIGNDWQPLVGEWFIMDETLRMEEVTTPPNKLASYTALPLQAPFHLEADLWGRSSSRWGGIAFHIQNASDYYAFRIRFAHDSTEANYQLLRVSGGGLSVLRQGPLPVSGDMLEPAGRLFRLEVDSELPGMFTVRAYDLEQPETPLIEVSHADSSFSGGTAGVYSNADRIVFTRFLVETTPQVWTESFFDGFNRSDSSTIGAGWTEMIGDWQIVSNLVRPGTLKPQFLAYDPLVLNEGFQVQAEVGSTTGDRWHGIAFNLQDLSNGYILRARLTHTPDTAAYQFLKYEDGSLSVLAKGSIPITDDMIIWTGSPDYKAYKMVVTSTEPGKFDLKIYHTSDLENPVVTTTQSDPTFSGGTAALYANDSSGVFDNFFVGAGWLGQSSDRFASWIDGFSLPPESRGAEDDASGDGVSNLMNYLLGTDPTVSNRDALPELVLHGAGETSHPGLSMLVANRDDVEILFELSTDLVTWTQHPLPSYAHHEVSPAGEGFSSITVWDSRTVAEVGDRWFAKLRPRLIE